MPKHLNEIVHSVRKACKNNASVALNMLFLIFILAVALRSIMPAYILASPDQDPFSLMLASKHRYLWENAVAVATGQWEFSTALTFYQIITAIPVYMAKLFSDSLSVHVASAQFFQGFMDSLGCFVVFAILKQYFSMRISLAGALLYAAWPPSIFYSYHILDEAYTPILVLTIGYCLMRFINTEKTGWLFAGGVLSGILFNLRVDNALLLFFAAVYIVWVFRQRWAIAASKAVLLVGIAMVTTMIINLAITKTLEIKTTSYAPYPKVFSAVFFNSLGEYPATYKGLRFFDDGPASAYAQEKLKQYNEGAYGEDSKVFQMLKKKTPEFAVFVKEVVLDKPFLYADWLVRRFVAYLPSHPYLATITYYLSAPGPKNEWWTIRGYRFSQVFHGMKYLDYMLFAIVALGVWRYRKNEGLMLFLWMYLGILTGHVATQCGEAYFRNDLEEVHLNPKYLLGMISIYPIFLTAKLSDLFDRFFTDTDDEMYQI